MDGTDFQAYWFVYGFGEPPNRLVGWWHRLRGRDAKS